MDWRRNASNGYEAYAYIQKRPISFQVTLDGRYLGWISNYDPQTRSTRPELYISGKCSTADEAMSYINGLVERLNKPAEVKKEEKTAEDVYVEKLTKDLDSFEESPAEKTPVEESPAEEVAETPTEENPTPQDNFADDKETDIAEEEKPAENPISFIVNENTMIIRSTKDGVLKYTTNGRDVNVSSKIYREPFSIEGVEVVKVKLFDTEKNVLSENEYNLSTN